jgi:AmmeMemoRadiSam system protein B
VGLDSYTKAFSAIQHLRPKRVVILATSHYAGLYPDTYREKPFIVSNKDFELPLRTFKTDKMAIRELLNSSRESGTDIGLTENDRAHRTEHSIELHLLFLSHIWQHNFQIIPILVSSLDDLLYMEKGHRGQQVENFSELIYERFGQDNETFFLISGDLAHIGRKFGDEQPAQSMFDEVREFDSQFLENAEESDEQKLLNLVGENHDPYRICGFPPLYLFLKSMNGLEGEVLTYDLWDEQERESAVSFGSILYRKNGDDK